MSYKKDLINSIEPNFVFSKYPINRFKFNELSSNIKDIDKKNKINNLKEKINSIQNCNLKKNSKNSVFGHGNLNSKIMIVGEAPNEEEEINNKTFMGESGALLDKMLLAINLSKRDIYSTYAINFKTPDDRKPTSQEIKRYSSYLKEHISIISPEIVILFGSTAMESILDTRERISNQRGKWKEIILKNKTFQLMITFSPSYLIRFPENKKYAWEDLKMIRQKISDLKIKI